MLTPGLILLADTLEVLRPDWHRNGVAAAFAQCQHQGRSDLEIARAVFVLAADDGVKSPTPLPLEGGHWLAPPARKPSWSDAIPKDALNPDQAAQRAAEIRAELEAKAVDAEATP